MIQLHSTKYFLVNFDEQNQLLHYIFHKTTEEMTSEEYIAELQVFIDLVKTYKPKRVLGNMIDFGFIITPAIQEWINLNLFEAYKQIDFQKIAILLSKGIFEQVSIQQTMEEGESNAFESRYFEDEATALDWLLG
ncbi:MAG: hypothetical protein MUE85_19750 [Microscillaceae bacterium]|jgi:hypothetical protein|nr:hypothetical protein [Microscillaceae bacterium]